MSDERRRIDLSEEDFGPPPPPPPPQRADLAAPGTNPVEQAAQTSGRFAWLSAIPAAAMIGAVAVAVTVGVVVFVSQPEEKTPAGFCAALEEGSEDIRANMPDTNAEGAEALRELIVAFGGIGRFQTMLDNMVEESPEEIKTEMTTSRDTFKETIDAVPGTAGSAATGDFTGALSGLLGVAFKSFVNEPSFEAVDAYAQEHCGSTVFGSQPQ